MFEEVRILTSSNYVYSINYGVKTGCNEAFIVDNETKDALIAQGPSAKEIIKPILRGKDIRRYQAQWSGLWVILAKYESHKYLKKKYPAVFNHLFLYKDRLQVRGQCRYGGKGNRGQHHWLELDNNPTDKYLTQFMHDKIVWSDISTEPTFHVLEREMYVNNTGYMIVGNDLKYLLGVLNSSVIAFYLPMIATGLGKKGVRYFKQFVEKLPVPRTNEKTCTIVQLVDKIISQQKDGKNTDSLESEIDRLVYQLYGLTEAEIDLVEDRK